MVRIKKPLIVPPKTVARMNEKRQKIQRKRATDVVMLTNETWRVDRVLGCRLFNGHFQVSARALALCVVCCAPWDSSSLTP